MSLTNGWRNRRCGSKGKQLHRCRPGCLILEHLEDRTLLTSNLYLDFGDNLPNGGLTMTVEQLRGLFTNPTPGIQGPDLEGLGNPAMRPTTSLQFTGMAPLVTFDYNGVGGTNNTDYTDLRAAVVAL